VCTCNSLSALWLWAQQHQEWWLQEVGHTRDGWPCSGGSSSTQTGHGMCPAPCMALLRPCSSASTVRHPFVAAQCIAAGCGLVRSAPEGGPDSPSAARVPALSGVGVCVVWLVYLAFWKVVYQVQVSQPWGTRV
jgi:hypothetical protein